MSKTKETDLDVGRTLTKVRRHKGSGKIEPRPRGKRSESYDYGYSDGSAFIPESDVDGSAKKKKAKADPEPKKRSRANDPAPTPAEVAAVMKAEKRKLEKKAGKKVSPKQAAIAKLTKQVKAADKNKSNEDVEKATLPVPAKKRGRPKGSKNAVAAKTPDVKAVQLGGDFSKVLENAVADAAAIMSNEKSKKALALLDSIWIGIADLRKFLES